MLLLLASLASAHEHKIEVSALPAAVTTAVQTRLPGAVIVSASQEDSTYEARVTLGTRKLDLAFSADGTWLEEEERIAGNTLPAAVKAAVDARWKGWKIERAERATTPTGATYEVEVEKGEKSAEVVLTDAGVVSKVKEESEEEDGDEEGDEHGEH